MKHARMKIRARRRRQKKNYEQVKTFVTSVHHIWKCFETQNMCNNILIIWIDVPKGAQFIVEATYIFFLNFQLTNVHFPVGNFKHFPAMFKYSSFECSIKLQINYFFFVPILKCYFSTFLILNINSKCGKL